MKTELVPGPVSHDDGATVFWAAHIPEGRWNGWLCPWFSPETVVSMVATVNAAAAREPELEIPSMTFEHGTLTLKVSYADGETDAYNPFHHDGVMYYQIGACSWMWAHA